MNSGGREGRRVRALVLALALSALVGGCSYSPNIEVRNESGQALTLLAQDGSHAIPDGGSVRVTHGLMYPYFALVTPVKRFQFERPEVPPREGFQRPVLGGLQGAISYWRIGPDARISVLRVDRRGRVESTPGPQPKGYPLVPSVSGR